MTNAIDSLRSEHDIILSAIERLESAAHAAPDGRLPRAYVRAVLDFIRVFVDDNHHAKEEYALFVEMAADPYLAPIADALTSDHDDGRRYVGEIEAALHENRPAAPAILAYATFIRGHIRRENDMVFETVENTFGDAAMENLDRRFREIEGAVLGADGLHYLLEPLDAYEAAAR